MFGFYTLLIDINTNKLINRITKHVSDGYASQTGNQIWAAVMKCLVQVLTIDHQEFSNQATNVSIYPVQGGDNIRHWTLTACTWRDSSFQTNIRWSYLHYI